MHVTAAAAEEVFDAFETSRELVVRVPERGFGLDIQLPGEIGDGEEKIAELLGGTAGALGQGGTELAQLFFDFLDDRRRIGPVESDSRDPFADFVGTEQRGKRPRNTVEDAGQSAGCRLLVRLDAFPLFEHGLRRASRPPAEQPATRREYVRMTTDEFGGDVVDHVRGVEAALGRGDLGMKDHLKQHVAELTAKRVQVAAVDGVERLIGLLEQVRPEGAVGLAAIPGTPAW